MSRADAMDVQDLDLASPTQAGGSGFPRAYVIVATRGRAGHTHRLLDYLERQTLQPAAVVVVGASSEDVTGLHSHPLASSGRLLVDLAGRAGLTAQRNYGVSLLTRRGDAFDENTFIAFFDDDFRPADDWLERAGAVLHTQRDIAGVTGHVLADGVRGSGLTEVDAVEYLSGSKPSEVHWSDLPDGAQMSSAYGCNMAFRASVFATCSFDEQLPLYGWQEDTDFSGQVRAFGAVACARQCRGVHLGVKQGRTSGVKFGYSQIANPIHIAGRGNMKHARAIKFIARAFAANLVYAIIRRPTADYPGRMRGNFLAAADLVRGRCDPQRILKL